MVHSYNDHVSILKFIERNWHLDPLTIRSRDNLPNPRAHEDNPYVPANAPAIGDLFDMFDLDQGTSRRRPLVRRAAGRRVRGRESESIALDAALAAEPDNLVPY